MKKLFLFALTSLVFQFNSFSQAITDTGTKVGIGDPTPTTELDVIGRIRSSNIGTTDPVYLFAIDDTNKFSMGYDADDDIFRINSRINSGGWYNRFTINKQDGFVGIGTTDPAYKFDVVSEVLNTPVASLQYHSTTLSNTNTFGLHLINKDQSATSVGGTKYSLYDDAGAGRNAAWIAVGKEQLWDAATTSTFKSFMAFGTRNGNGGIKEALRITNNGKVGIGTTAPDAELTVDGMIHSEEVKVDLTVPGPDYVFAPDYDLRSLEETSAYITQNRHLPEIPPAKEMEAHGIDLGVMNMKLLQKVEELTLYLIEQNKQIQSQQQEIEELKKTTKRLEKR